MLPRNMPRKKLRNGKLLLLMPLGDLAEDGPVDCTSLGEALRLELAALAAFGNGKNKGKRKSKGKLVRSNLTLEQRRAKLAEIKPKSKCLRCGGTGHWAGDPVCRFPNGKGKATTPASQSKPYPWTWRDTDRLDGLYTQRCSQFIHRTTCIPRTSFRAPAAEA